MARLIFLGAPGAGKGTQAQLLAESLNIPHISTGDILRAAIANVTPLGEKAQSYMDRGELVPDDLLLDLIRERLAQPDTQNGWILDGFPRNVSQASFLTDLLAELNQTCDYAINLEVPDEVLIERLLSRGRKDDNRETIGRRLEVYREQTAPVIGFYQDKSALKSINGNRPMDEVTESLKNLIDA
ncbi:adenylate kinase [Limnofasciculus baicalensis]|uniref:Adenylate kinase n=1 Tax=Limnofasciculus baicalensis BBK-W-15 TaxID=2699891 RepID=A0AAE3KL98_9CYAN|nr:adenylate kinase [Limnofasciculus baicalensis]MCP2727859.1 adenylate kinase [Limnofasciculus baicalensis BBK-W-15]